MSMELKQQLRLSQQLVMTPQLQQAIKLLQLTRMELAETIREEMMENPVLEDAVDADKERTKEREEFDAEGRSEATLAAIGETELAPPEVTRVEKQEEVKADGQAVNELDWASYLEDHAAAPPMPSYRPSGEDLPSLEATLTKRPSLFEHLVWQLGFVRVTAEQHALATMILGNLDEDGYLRDPPLSEIAADRHVTIEAAEEVLKLIQRFDPIGVAARTLEECLLLQVAHAGTGDVLVVNMIKGHIANLEKRNYHAIARDLHESFEEICEAAKVIMELDPRPGRLYSAEEPSYVTPDVYVHKVGDKYFVVPNDDGLPKLKISSFYRKAFSGSREARAYIQDKLRSAQWLIRSIQQRQRTIVRVTESIIKFQAGFFERGISHLKPLILRDVAEEISMHESTISRVTTNKYVHTPQGIFELKFFFNSGIARTDGDEVASEAVKTQIKSLIASENSSHPHSDQRIVEILREHKIDIARRTVAKYRDQLGILSSSKRKQVFPHPGR